MLTVGAFALITGLSARTLRAYDELGLFRPAWVDPASGYRYYSPAQLPEVRRIQALRSLGIGLAEIGRLVEGRVDLEAALVRRRDELESERREVERRLAALDIRIESGAGHDRGLDVVVRRVAAETVASLRLDLLPHRDEEAAFDELEAYVRDRGRRAARPPGAVEDRVFVPLTGPVQPSGRVIAEVLPEIPSAATVLHRGGYGTMARTVAFLERWIEATRHRPAGPLRVIYLQFGADPVLAVPRGYVVDDPAAYVTELQLPVDRRVVGRHRRRRAGTVRRASRPTVVRQVP